MNQSKDQSENLASFLIDLDRRFSLFEDRGKVADYIPELADVDPKHFAMSIALADGTIHEIGDYNEKFSIQSVSKVFTLAIALGRYGQQLWERVGVEPSGQAFNSIVQLELEKGIPRNPFVNAGAIVTTDALLTGGSPRTALAEIVQFLRMAAGDDDIFISDAVAKSEAETGHRNYSLGHFLKSFGNLNNSVEQTLGTYFHQCAIEMTTTQLAKAGRFLADIRREHRLISNDRVRSINALMMTCGHYDGSGSFAYRVGLPGKSGVGGGILAIVPDVASIAVWSPGLDEFGNSQLGTAALEAVAKHMAWSVF